MMPVIHDPQQLRAYNHKKPAFIVTTIIQLVIHADDEAKALEIFKEHPLYTTYQGGLKGEEYWSGTGQIVSVTRRDLDE